MPRQVSKQKLRQERSVVLGVTGNKSDFKWLCKRKDNRFSIVSEGDSWFSYPPQWLLAGPNSNVVDHIYDFIGRGGERTANLLRLESHGDEVRTMTSGRQFDDLKDILTNCQPDLLLFSGGGNDIVGKYDLCPLLNPYRRGYTAAQCIDTDRFDRRKSEIADSFEHLLEACRLHSPNTFVVTHNYDIPQPRDVGARFLWGLEFVEPWIHPYLVKKGIRDSELQLGVIQHILSAFREDLDVLAEQHDQLRVADTQGTLIAGSDDDWLNEIHPTPSGFRRIAEIVYAEMRAVRPGLPALARSDL